MIDYDLIKDKTDRIRTQEIEYSDLIFGSLVYKMFSLKNMTFFRRSAHRYNVNTHSFIEMQFTTAWDNDFSFYDSKNSTCDQV